MEIWPSNHKPPRNDKAEEELRNLPGHHSYDLYDQNESASGEKTDLATGRPIDNTGEESTDAQLQVVDSGAGHEDALPPVRERDDAAARWLRENDTDFKR